MTTLKNGHDVHMGHGRTQTETVLTQYINILTIAGKIFKRLGWECNPVSTATKKFHLGHFSY